MIVEQEAAARVVIVLNTMSKFEMVQQPALRSWLISVISGLEAAKSFEYVEAEFQTWLGS